MENHTEDPKAEKSEPKLYLLIHNICKPMNVGMMIRSASAFNVSKVFLISKDPESKKSSKLFKNFGLKYGDKGTSAKMDYHYFFSVAEAKTYFNERGITICGIEIGNGARSVTEDPWKGDTVLVPGNEGLGLLDNLKEICDQFVYIPQYTSKTASLNVTTAASIVMHRFACWAKYQEQETFGEKFQDPAKEKEEYDEMILRLRESAALKKLKISDQSKNPESESNQELAEEQENNLSEA